MHILLMIPKVVKNYIASLPESMNNAYKYFNYDHRILNERVFRGDMPSTYKGPNQFTNEDYDGLVNYAKTKVNPILLKYSKRIANEDALNLSIKDYNKGMFDGKINANKFTILVEAMESPGSIGPKTIPMGKGRNIFPEIHNQIFHGAKKETPKKKPAPKKEDKAILPHVLKQLGIKTHAIPLKTQILRKVQKGVPYLVREPGKGVKIQKSDK